MATEKRRYIRKNGSPHILPFTDALASRDDTYECDEKGNKVAQADPPVEQGIQPPVHLRDHAAPGRPTTESTFHGVATEPEPITTLQSDEDNAKQNAAAIAQAEADAKAKEDAKAAKAKAKADAKAKKADKAKADAK